MTEKSMAGVPYSPDIEKAVLGFIINSQNTDDLLSKLSSDHFYLESNRVVFEMARSLQFQNLPIDIITMCDKLLDCDISHQKSCRDTILEITEMAPVSLNIDSYVNILREKLFLRKLIKICQNAIFRAGGEDFALPDFIDGLEREFFEILSFKDEDGPRTMVPVIHSTIEKMEKLLQSDGMTGVPSGFKELDAITGGFQPQDLIILAARAGVGKTAMLLNFLLNAALCGKSVLIFSIEMSKEQIAQRLLSKVGKINSQNLRKGHMSDDELDRLMGAARTLSALDGKFSIDDGACLTLMQLRSRCRKHRKKYGLDIVAVDYLQLMRPQMDKKYDSEVHVISEISKGLKGLAKELNIPVIALAQLNRELERRVGDKRPKVADLKGSGSIEQDADLVLLLHREEVVNPGTDQKGIAELIIGKNRFGPTATVKLAYHAETVSFLNLIS
ncbi:MAG: replicative DNA helicase [Oligoflexales bacterium]|nr:replicative DNA helicase [Oligoflexales bacterium]